MSRAKSRRNLDYMDVLNALEEQGISIRVASPKLVMEEVGELLKSIYVIDKNWNRSTYVISSATRV